MPKRSSNRNALTLMVGTLGSRVSGFLRQSLLTQLFDKQITDAFFVALRVPNLFRELLAEGALTNSFIPIYKSLDKKEARRLASALLAILLIANGLLLLLAYFAAPFIVDLLLAKGGNVDRDLTITLTRIVFPFLMAVSLSAWAMGILNAEEEFFAPAWAPVALNLVAIILMLLYPQSTTILAWGFVLGGVVQLLVQLPALFQGNYVAAIRGVWHPQLGAVLLLMVPFAVTTSGRQVLNVVTTNILDTLPQGSVTGFQNADLFLSLALGLFGVSPALAYYSRLSGTIKEAPESFADILLNGLKFISFLSAPAGLLLMLLASPAVETVFNWFTLLGRDGADPATLSASVQALFPLGLAIWPLGLNNLLIRSFYVRQRVRTPIVLTFIFLSLQGLLYYLLTPFLGIAGLSLATAVVAWLQLFTMLILVGRREGLDLPAFMRHGLKILFALAVAALLSWGLLSFLPLAQTWLMNLTRVILGALCLYLVYLAMALWLKLPELAQLSQRFRKR
ncbi:MAG: murein biosynthesis integral membrane protein MurJ [Trueperaceae bacterium]|nr:murein biosynthesis integral membrane protein MurJ [Trueperaceae bacterium]